MACAFLAQSRPWRFVGETVMESGLFGRFSIGFAARPNLTAVVRVLEEGHLAMKTQSRAIAVGSKYGHLRRVTGNFPHAFQTHFSVHLSEVTQTYIILRFTIHESRRHNSQYLKDKYIYIFPFLSFPLCAVPVF